MINCFPLCSPRLFSQTFQYIPAPKALGRHHWSKDHMPGKISSFELDSCTRVFNAHTVRHCALCSTSQTQHFRKIFNPLPSSLSRCRSVSHRRGVRCASWPWRWPRSSLLLTHTLGACDWAPVPGSSPGLRRRHRHRPRVVLPFCIYERSPGPSERVSGAWGAQLFPPRLVLTEIWPHP